MTLLLGMKIPKGNHADESIKPAWLPNQDADGRPLKPLFRCACGQIAGLGSHHVYPDGRVMDSFRHPGKGWKGHNAPGCGFHEFLELEGYDGPEFPPETR